MPLDFLGWRFFVVSHQVKPVDSHTHKKRTLAQIKKGNNHGSARVGTLGTRSLKKYVKKQ